MTWWIYLWKNASLVSSLSLMLECGIMIVLAISWNSFNNVETSCSSIVISNDPRFLAWTTVHILFKMFDWPIHSTYFNFLLNFKVILTSKFCLGVSSTFVGTAIIIRPLKWAVFRQKRMIAIPLCSIFLTNEPPLVQVAPPPPPLPP